MFSMMCYADTNFLMELSAVANKVRKSIRAVGVVIEPYDRRLSVDELISICATSNPSSVGMLLFNFCC